MGPRSIDRGNKLMIARKQLYDQASMGPRSIDRGNSFYPNLF